jgi:hypothetical protein
LEYRIGLITTKGGSTLRNTVELTRRYSDLQFELTTLSNVKHFLVAILQPAVALDLFDAATVFGIDLKK